MGIEIELNFFVPVVLIRGISIPLGEVRNVEIERVTQRDDRISGKMRF